MKLLLLLLLGLNLVAAENNYSLRAAVGKPTLYSAADIATGSFGKYRDDLKAYNIDAGYLLFKDILEWPLDLYLKGGLAYYDESSQSNTYGADVYFKFYYNLDFWKNRVRIGLGEGISYTSRILEIERIDAENHNDNNSHFLNYIDFSIGFDIGKLIRYKELHETYIGFLVKHRSGIFGTINNVRHGGSNYQCIYVEKNF